MTKQIQLKYSSGQVLSDEIHEIGLIALGSHRENHGTALPIDTDTKIASNVTLNVATETGATYLGVIYAATEYDYIKHGIHIDKNSLINEEIIPTLIHAKKLLQLKSVIIINGHGGNNIIKKYIPYIAKSTKLNIIFNNAIIENEGPHACTGELSMGNVLGILDENQLQNHSDYIKNPEVGMVGLKEAREKEPMINKEAEMILKKGFEVDYNYGKELLNNAKKDIIKDIQLLLI